MRSFRIRTGCCLSQGWEKALLSQGHNFRRSESVSGNYLLTFCTEKRVSAMVGGVLYCRARVMCPLRPTQEPNLLWISGLQFC